ncbi:hypothetical protein ACFL6I_08085 [candidate division KSB1 bacterium]
MKGFLIDTVRFNGMTLEPGTEVYLELEKTRFFNQIDPDDSIIVTVYLDFCTIKIIVRKSQIELAA